MRHLVYTDRLDDAGDFAWSLLIYWWIAGFFAEVRVWMLELLGKELPITQHTRAVAWFFALWGEMWQRPSDGVVAGLGECVRLFAESGDEDASAMAIAARATARLSLPMPDVKTAAPRARPRRSSACTRSATRGPRRSPRSRGAGWRGCSDQRDEALAHFSRALEIAEASGDLFTLSVAGNHQARLLLVRGEVDAAEEACIRTLLVSIRLHHEEGIAYGLEGLCTVAAAARRRRAGGHAVGGRRRHPPPHRRLRRRGVPRAHAAARRDPRRPIRQAVAAGERRGAELTRRRGDRPGAARGGRRCELAHGPGSAQW